MDELYNALHSYDTAPEHANYAEDLRTVGGDQVKEDINERDDNENAIHHVPSIFEVRIWPAHCTASDHLHAECDEKRLTQTYAP